MTRKLRRNTCGTSSRRVFDMSLEVWSWKRLSQSPLNSRTFDISLKNSHIPADKKISFAFILISLKNHNFVLPEHLVQVRYQVS